MFVQIIIPMIFVLGFAGIILFLGMKCRGRRFGSRGLGGGGLGGSGFGWELQRIYDLIPNLVSSVKGYMQFERQTLEDITKLRSQWMQTPDTAQRVNLSNQLESTLSKIILTYEAYSELKSDSTVTRLMDELAGTENRISVSRTAYNDGVRDYNLHLRTFPNNVFNENGFLGAKAWAYKQYPQYDASAGGRNIVPQVNLNLIG